MEKRVKLVLEYKDFVDRATEKQEQSVKIHLQALQADSDHRAMETMVKEKDEELEEKQAELRQGALLSFLFLSLPLPDRPANALPLYSPSRRQSPRDRRQSPPRRRQHRQRRRFGRDQHGRHGSTGEGD